MKEGWDVAASPSFYYNGKELTRVKLKICKILTGAPVIPIVAGSPAIIYHHGHVTRTTAVVDVYRESVTEIWFETRNTVYTLKIDSTDIKEEGKYCGCARKAHD